MSCSPCAREFRKLEKPINEAEFRVMEMVEERIMNINLHIERLVLDGVTIEPQPAPAAASGIADRTDPACLRKWACRQVLPKAWPCLD